MSGQIKFSEYLKEKKGYVIWFIALLITIRFIWLSGFDGNAGSARYLLSAIGQGLAAILALSFTIPLIAIQLAASRYGIKIFDIFFDKITLSFMIITSFSTFFPFFILTKLERDDSEILTINQQNYLTIALILFVIVLFLLIIFIYRLKEKLIPENIIESYAEEIKNLVSERNLEIAKKRAYTLKNIGISVAREREDIAFGEFLERWVDLIFFKDVKWLKNVLLYNIQKIFEIIAREDASIAEDGLDKLQTLVVDFLVEKKNDKALEIIALFPLIVNPLISSNPAVVRHSFYDLRGMGEMISIIPSEPDVVSKVLIASIESLKNIGEIAGPMDHKLSEDAIDEISNIVHHYISTGAVVKKGIECIAALGEFSRVRANERLLQILDSISTGASRVPSLSTVYKVDIAKSILPVIREITSLHEVSELIIIASRFLKEDENSSIEILIDIARMLKEIDVQSMDTISWLKIVIENAKKLSVELKFDLPIDDFGRKYLFA